MAKNRENLHAELVDILGANNVYYQPPESIKLKYPCIIYSRDDNDTTFADDKPYLINKRYQLLLIYKDPDSDLTDKVLGHFPYSRFDRQYTSDNLYHSSVNIYY